MSAKFAELQEITSLFCNIHVFKAICIQHLGLKLKYCEYIVASVRGLPGHADPGGVPGLAAARLAAGAVRGHADRPHTLHLRIHLRRLPHRHTQVSQLSLSFYNILQLYNTIQYTY